MKHARRLALVLLAAALLTAGGDGVARGKSPEGESWSLYGSFTIQVREDGQTTRTTRTSRGTLEHGRQRDLAAHGFRLGFNYYEEVRGRFWQFPSRVHYLVDPASIQPWIHDLAALGGVDAEPEYKLRKAKLRVRLRSRGRTVVAKLKTKWSVVIRRGGETTRLRMTVTYRGSGETEDD